MRNASKTTGKDNGSKGFDRALNFLEHLTSDLDDHTEV
jgi:hypothetical protein